VCAVDLFCTKMAAYDATLSRMEAVCARLEAAAAKMGAPAEIDADAVPQYVIDWDAIMSAEVAALGEAYLAIEFPEGWACIEGGFTNVRDYISKVHKSKKPTPAEFQEALGPCIEQMNAADGLTRSRDKRIFRNFDLHAKVTNTIMASLNWVAVVPPQGLPKAIAQDALEGSDFYLNKILKNKKDDNTKAWVAAIKALCNKQVEYVNEYFKTGLTWNNAKGVSILECDGAAPAAAAPAEEAAAAEEAAPAPVEPAAPKAAAKKAAPSDGVNMLAALNSGLAITSGLKKVKKSQKTKYRKNRAGKVTMVSKKAKAKRELPPPSKTKRGFTWMIEYYQDSHEEINDMDGKLTLKNGLFFSQCLNQTFIVNPKVKSIMIDSCQKCRIQIHDVVSAVELVNCKSVTLYCNGVIPSVTIDKSESPRIVFMNPAWNAENLPTMVTSNVTAGNVEIPSAEEDGDMIEIPMCEQYVTTFNRETRSAHTVPMTHGG